MRVHIIIRTIAAVFLTGSILVGCGHSNAASLGQAASTGEISAAEEVCDAVHRPPISSRDYVLNRPDDFYALCYARDKAVCATAHEYLNEVARPKAKNALDKSVFQVIGARFWQDRSAIPWRGEVVNAAKLDIFNDGKTYAVFQDRVGYGGIKTPTLFISEPLTSAEDINLDSELFLALRSSNESAEAGGLGPRNLHPIFPREYWWMGSSVAQIKGRNYAVFYAPADSFPVGRVSIVEMSDRLTGEHVCKFQARYQIQENE